MKSKKKTLDMKSYRFCPRCKSLNVTIDPSNPLIGSMGMPGNYVCRSCGYTAKIFPEIDAKNLKKLKQMRANQNLKSPEGEADVSLGKFNMNYWKFSSIFSIVLGFVLLFTLTGVYSIILPIFFIIIGFIQFHFAYKKTGRKDGHIQFQKSQR